MIEIELNNIKKNYGIKNILNGFNLQVKTGERIAIIGENGAGKSTILKIIKGIENVDSGDINIRKGASIEFLNQIYKIEDSNLTVREFISLSFKECFELEKRMRALEDDMKSLDNQMKMEELLRKYGNIQEKYSILGGYDIQEKFSKICSGFNIDEKMLKIKYNELSGGEKAIINLAALLLRNPDILLLDEPTNHLDIQRLEWLEKFLNNYKGTVLLVSHDRYFLDKVVTKTILLENGKDKVYFGNYSYFLEEDERRILSEFEKYKNQQKQIEKMKESIKKLRHFGDIAQNELFYKRAKSIEKRLEKMQIIDKVKVEKAKMNLSLNVKERSGKDVVIVDNLLKNFDQKIIFEQANLHIQYGEKVCLIGNNGSGKSTLLKIILQEDKKFKGKVTIGSSVKIGYIPQEIKFENEKETIYDFFEKNMFASETEIRTLLAKYGFRGENVFKKLKNLSGGERVRVLLIKLMQDDINFLILDEPTNHIDISSREVLEEALKKYKGTILFVSHDRYFIKAITSRILEVKDKKLETKIL